MGASWMVVARVGAGTAVGRGGAVGSGTAVGGDGVLGSGARGTAVGSAGGSVAAASVGAAPFVAADGSAIGGVTVMPSSRNWHAASKMRRSKKGNFFIPELIAVIGQKCHFYAGQVNIFLGNVAILSIS